MNTKVYSKLVTLEAHIVANIVDKLPKEEREKALKIMQLVFPEYASELNLEETESD